MKKRRSEFLSEFVVNQYPVEKFKELIFIALDITENFLMVLESGFNYNSITISSYAEKYVNKSGISNSKVEGLLIKNLKTNQAMHNFLNSYYNAYNSLNVIEKNIFDATFIDKLTDLEIIDKYKTHSVQIRKARKSAIIRFSLKMGLDKFVDIL